MAGKAPLLLAVVLFAIGASGLALSSAGRARWGPFEPGSMPATQQVRVVDSGTPFAVPSLPELFTSQVQTAVSSEPEPEPTAGAAAPAASAIPPLRVYGISSDDGGVSAAAASPSPPPLTVTNVASDGDDDGATPQPHETPEASVDANSGDPYIAPPEAQPHEIPSNTEPPAHAWQPEQPE